MSSVVDFLCDRFREYNDADAIVCHDTIYSYRALATNIESACKFLKQNKIQGATVLLETNYSINGISMFFALLKNNCIVIPLLPSSPLKDKIITISQTEYIVTVSLSPENFYCTHTDSKVDNCFLEKLKREKSAGLILFSSGTTGEPKGVVHNVTKLIKKYKSVRYSKRTLAILLFDHIGGIDNLLYTLSNGGCLVICDPLTPEESCRLIEKYKIQVFPTSPSFLNLLILSDAYQNKDLKTLEIITYGSEVMPQYLLKHLKEILPDVKFIQKYGLTEIGTLRSHSKSSDSLWVKIGGEGFETRVVDGMLQIKAESAMLGYLNAPSPFTEDGWFMTGDEVEVDGDYYLIKGRRSEIINVGGQKVYPAEVESVILQMDGVLDAVVSGEKNPLLGNIVVAKVHLQHAEPVKDFIKRLNLFCIDKLQRFQVPQRVTLMEHDFTNARFKKIRR